MNTDSETLECCGTCGMGQCYIDEITGENSEGWGWQR